MKISELFDNQKEFRQEIPGIWMMAPASGVHYPIDGNETCRRVEDASFWFCHRNDCIAAMIRNYPPKGFILDIGGAMDSSVSVCRAKVMRWRFWSQARKAPGMPALEV